MAQSKEKKIRNTLERHEVDRKLGGSIINDFLQLGLTLDRLKELDEKAYHAMLCLVEEKLDLEKKLKERGQRISELQRKVKN